MGWPGFFSTGLLRPGDELAGADLLDRFAQLVDRQGVVQPGVVQRIAELLAQHGHQLAAARDQRPAGRAGIVGHHVEHVDRAVIGGLENAAAGLQPRDHGNRPVLHAAGSSPMATLNRLLKASTRVPL